MFKRYSFLRFLFPAIFGFGMVPEDDGGGAGGGEGDGAGGGEGDGGEGGKGGRQKDDVVARADHERALADMKKYKKEAEQARLDRKAADEARMKEQNQWKELAEARETEAKAAKEETDRIKNSYLNDRKSSAVQIACGKLGLRPEALGDLEMLDLEQVQIETTSTGKINVLGADKFAERLKTLKPHWFADKAAPHVNTKDGTRVLDSSGEITVKQIMDAEKEGRKSGDFSKYHELHKKFQQQRASGR